MSISDLVKVALISAIANIIVAYLGNRTKRIAEERKAAARDQYIDDVIDRFDDRLDKIENKVDEHNNYAKRFESVDNRTTKIEKDIEYLKERS